LHYENALENATVDEWNAEEGLVGIFAGFAEILEARVKVGLFDGHGIHLFSHQAGEAFGDRHAQVADAFAAKADGCGQDQIAAVGLKQVGGANVGLESIGDQSNDVHQGLGGFALPRREVGDFI
jgi:hypothetical protein